MHQVLQNRGGLKYPAKCVAVRFWTIHIFFKKLLPELRNYSKLVDDLGKYLTPKMSVCPEFKSSADGSENGVKKRNILLEQKPIVENKPEKRKVLRLQK
ncbi:hypothetical protein OUZ56_009694 [Daphnia magna]|uniref:Uncharacterized protein n=1 Tax=Daphnia magna TaxID=35525 RepID=A0ABR0AGT6_9CRUS|nr:hypothetical protein OUZ56_009694 [Daphnia magna]